MDKAVKSEELDTYFEEAIEWDQLRYQQTLKSNKTLKLLAWLAFIYAVVATSSIFLILPLKEYIPIVIRVNELTGKYDVQGRGFEFDIKDKRNEATIYQDVVKYLKSRESFTRGQAETLFNTAYLMSCTSVREDVKNYYLADKNPNSPLHTMRPEDSVRIDVKYYAFMPAIDEGIKTVQVRYEKTTDIKGRDKEISRYIATISFKYSKNNIPDELNDRSLNAFGFCAINYQTSQEGRTDVVKEVKEVKRGIH